MLFCVTFVLSAVGSALPGWVCDIGAFQDSHSWGWRVKFPTLALSSRWGLCYPQTFVIAVPVVCTLWDRILAASFQMVIDMGSSWHAVELCIDSFSKIHWLVQPLVSGCLVDLFVQSSIVLRGRAIESVSSWPGVGLPILPSMWWRLSFPITPRASWGRSPWDSGIGSIGCVEHSV